MGNDVASVRIGKFIGTEIVTHVLGLAPDIPLQHEEMLQNLTVTFYRANPISSALGKFFKDLQAGFIAMGVKILPFEDTLNKAGKVKQNIAVFVAGMDHDPKDMMVNKVSSLYQNPIIGVYEGDCPVRQDETNQRKLDTIISLLAYDIVHIAIFANSESWTICTMNGALIENPMDQNKVDVILESLVPKLTAQVIPPNILSEIRYRQDLFDPTASEYSTIIADLSEATASLRDDGLIMSHTSVSSLKMRSKFHERIVKAYLDQRTGMSYGFMVWQLPVKSRPAKLIGKNEISKAKDNVIDVQLLGEEYQLEIPEVWVLATRSGCDKSNLDIGRDIVRMGLKDGKIYFDLPLGYDTTQDVKPSYDTLAILAHALGNSIISSLLKTVSGDNSFSKALDSNGISLFHWHGYLPEHNIPTGHFVHGAANPSVSCSTRQSAVYSLLGKLEALEDSLANKTDFLGDVHVEPHHGTNISSTKSLSDIVDFLHSLNI
jgi:hypothetical protein